MIHRIRLTIDVNGDAETYEIRIDADDDALDALDPREIADAFGHLLEMSLAESDDDGPWDVESLLDVDDDEDEDDDGGPWSVN